MTIPSDPEDRWWCELSGANPKAARDRKSGLVLISAAGNWGEIKIVGTGFIIANGPGFAAVLTAKHVLTEGALRKQRPKRRSAPSALFVPEHSEIPSIEPKDLKALWQGTYNSLSMDCVYAHYTNDLDIACCLIATQGDNEEKKFRPTTIPIDTTIPKKGDVVHLISLAALGSTTVALDKSIREDNMTRQHTITSGVSFRMGVVTGVYLQGYRQFRWPCFTTSIPAEPGMSGGFVTIFRDYEPVTACGVVCADCSSEESRRDLKLSGNSVIACSWTALGMPLPTTIPTPTAERQSIYDFMRSGLMPVASGGIDHLDIQPMDDGGYSIKLKH